MEPEFSLPKSQIARYDILIERRDNCYVIESYANELGGILEQISNLSKKITDKYHNTKEVRIQIDVK